MSDYQIIECRQLTPEQREELIAMLQHVCRENGVLEPFPVLHAVRQLVEHIEALEAALADVPEHPQGVAVESFREEHRARERAEARIAELETRLQRAHDWLYYDISGHDLAKLEAILDGKEGM